MTTTRVLVAHDAGARLFDQKGPGKGLIELRSVPFEDGRRMSSEIDADRPGRAFDRRGGGRHAYEPHEDPKTHAVSHFAKTLAEDLTQAHHRGEFQQLILVAPPRFLGLLRDSLGTKLQRIVVGAVAKDLPRADARELRLYLEPYVAC